MDGCNKVTYLRGMNTIELDAKGLLCPLPVLKLRKRLKSLPAGDAVLLIADDPAAVIDVPHFCQESGFELVEARDSNGARTYLVRKPG